MTNTIQWLPLTGTSCDDGDICTHSDACTNRGLCVGTLITCVSPCQQCDGTSQCRTQGCLTPQRNCGCGVCYNNNAVNPSKQCHYCNIASSPNSWTNYPTQPCDDGNSCTRHVQRRNVQWNGLHQRMRCAHGGNESVCQWNLL